MSGLQQPRVPALKVGQADRCLVCSSFAYEAHHPTPIFRLTLNVPARPNRSKRCGAPGRLEYLGDITGVLAMSYLMVLVVLSRVGLIQCEMRVACSSMLAGKFTKTGSPAKSGSGGTSNKSNPYAEFTKTHMREISQSLPAGTPQKQVMVEVGRRWREHKAALEAAGEGASGTLRFATAAGSTAGDAEFARHLQIQLDVGVMVD